jgi:MerR family copper efflux transcriptional regulator
MKTANTLTIGKVAARAGVGVETIRFYERERLLPEPDRDPTSNYRRYSTSIIARLKFIARAKELGFTLNETRELLELHSAKTINCKSVKARADEKIAAIQRKISDLQQMETTLVQLVEACPGEIDQVDCPILRTLEKGFMNEG